MVLFNSFSFVKSLNKRRLQEKYIDIQYQETKFDAETLEEKEYIKEDIERLIIYNDDSSYCSYNSYLHN